MNASSGLNSLMICISNTRLKYGFIDSCISSASNPQKEGASAASARAFESGKFKWGKSATLTVGNSNDKLGARVKCEASHPDTISANRWEKPLEIACKLRQK